MVACDTVSFRVSIHAPRAGRDGAEFLDVNLVHVSIHAPRAGRDAHSHIVFPDIEVSIHAPRAGRDKRSPFMWPKSSLFQSTRPARGATARSRSACHREDSFNPRAPRGARRFGGGCLRDAITFQSTRPARGATVRPSTDISHCGFNPRAPRGARHPRRTPAHQPRTVSIHAPRAGRDGYNVLISAANYLFQSTRPARGATAITC